MPSSLNQGLSDDSLPDGLPFIDTSTDRNDGFPVDLTGSRSPGRRKDQFSKNFPWLALVGIALALACLGLGYFVYTTESRPKSKITLQVPSVLDLQELQAMSLDVGFQVDGVSLSELTFSLIDPPRGASISARSGRITWKPDESQGPGTFSFAIRVTADRDPKTVAEARTTVSVREVESPPQLDPIADQEIDTAEVCQITVRAEDRDIPASEVTYRLAPGSPKGARIDASTGLFEWNPQGQSPGDYPVVVQAKKGSPRGLSSTRSFTIHLAKSERLVDRPAIVAQTAKAKVNPADVTHLIALALDRGKLFDTRQYRELRKIFANRFEERYAAEINQAYGDDDKSMTAWLLKHPDVREEFYTAIDPQADDIVGALRIFKDLKTQFPDTLELYRELAIAIAITWDRERSGLYDYAGHSARTKSTMPGGLLDAAGSFRYHVQADTPMQGWMQGLPWEFLLHVVDHKTPVVERRWALENYLAFRNTIGACYGQVPYDTMMLQTRSKMARLNDQLYTLPNLRTYGGVCAMQADFAARVGKSNGVPSAYVGGESSFNEGHAWVMWVEIKEVNQKGISFALNSHGRYQGDHYYVGHLHDPQTGKGISDRQLELRLHTVGVGPVAKRYTALLMDAFPLIRDQAQLTTTDQMKFLGRIIEMCPTDEAAWLELAKLAREGKVTPEHGKLMNVVFDQLFQVFDSFPDFTWAIFDDLISSQVKPLQKVTYFGKLIDLYESAGRPDLACEARLKQCELLMASDKPDNALAALNAIVATIRKFPEEGRYVPKLLDKLESICRKHNVGADQVVQFYTEFLPRIPQKRGSEPSKYCMATYERAILMFKKNGQPQLAQAYAAELANLRAQAIP